MNETQNQRAMILRLILILVLASHCSSFSATSPTLTATTSTTNGIFSSPLAGIKRIILKKQLIQAAEVKDEELVLSLVDELSQLNPTSCATLGLAGYNGGTGSEAPLNGSWRLLYTNAQDAEAPARTEKKADEKFGDTVAKGVEVRTGQCIDGASGKCVNFIMLEGDDKRPFDKLEIIIKMTPLNDSRVRLDFLKANAKNERAPLPFLRDVTFNFPPASLYDTVARLRGQDPDVEPQAYFDVLYIDDEIRAHRTGEGKIFVQKRGS